MMISLRKAADRGATRIDWLDSRHTFSFGGYRDSRFTGFRDLLVINEDRVLPGAGFPTHPHRDMEIVSYVIAGALAHRDSLGTGSVIRPGEVQRMSAGTGIRHSEYNASESEPVHFLQIWITPERAGLPPGYEQVALPAANGASRLDLIGGRTGGAGAVTIHQDVAMWRACVQPGETLALPIAAGRAAWVQVVGGRARVNGHEVAAGDGLALAEEAEVTMTGIEPAELLIFDLA
jgi:redox-sensitive bicupin YhaK (pirin superfamily)